MKRSGSLALSPDGSTLAIGDAAGFLRLVDVSSGSDLLKPIPAHIEDDFDLSTFPDDAELPGAHDPSEFPLGVRSIDFSLDGGVVATAGGTHIRTWSTMTGEPIHSVGVVRPSTIRDGVIQVGRPTDLDIRDGGSTAIVRTNRFIQIWNLEEGTQVDHAVILSDSAAAIADNGVVALSLGQDMGLMAELNLVAQIDLETGATIRTFDLQSAASEANVGLSPDERIMVSGGADGIIVWALDGSGLISRKVTAPREDASAVRASPDGRLLAVNSENDAVFSYSLWDISEDEASRIPMPARAGRLALALDGLILVQDGRGIISVRAANGPDREIGQLGALNNYSEASSPDGTTFVIGTGEPDDALLHIFDTRTLEPIGLPITLLEDLGASRVVSMSFDPTGSRLAVATAEGIAVVLDTETWEIIGVPLGSGGGQVISVEFSPDGRFLATGDETGRIMIRNPGTLQPEGEALVGSNSGVTFASAQPLAFSDDGGILLSTIDGVGRMWDVESRSQIGTPIRSDPGTNISPSPDGDFLPVISEGRIVLYELEVGLWFDIACTAAGRNFTEREWAQFGAEDAERQRTCPQWELD